MHSLVLKIYSLFDGKWYMEKAVNNVKIEIEINQDQAKIIMRKR